MSYSLFGSDKAHEGDNSRHRPLTQRLLRPAEGTSAIDEARTALHTFAATAGTHPKLGIAGAASGFDEAGSAE
ncbi:MAG: hypothetical protein M3Q31_22645 [Actinomycetota bacterium]|nr:hypothetical protein [Actinomycetota bacterium]